MFNLAEQIEGIPARIDHCGGEVRSTTILSVVKHLPSSAH